MCYLQTLMVLMRIVPSASITVDLATAHFIPAVGSTGLGASAATATEETERTREIIRVFIFVYRLAFH